MKLSRMMRRWIVRCQWAELKRQLRGTRVGLRWWGHETCEVKSVEMKPGQFDVKLDNNWRDQWDQ